ncbi:MAG: GNAT family N-acetyltransferase [Planctomycetota bacterium]|nr:GNAT family N-acetyltransferase [Planctomycetota bacterium]
MSVDVIREGSLQDLETIVAFNAALAEESEGLTPDRSTLTEGVKALLEDPAKGRYYLAEVDGSVVGQLAVTFEWSDWRNGMFLWLQSVYIAAEHRRKGVFTSLYRHVEQLASRPGYCGIRLYVHDENETARATYLRRGMVSSGYEVLETPDALKDDPVTP